MDIKTSKSKSIQTMGDEDIYQAYNGQYYKQTFAVER